MNMMRGVLDPVSIPGYFLVILVLLSQKKSKVKNNTNH
jgi:hypothetical protein